MKKKVLAMLLSSSLVLASACGADTTSSSASSSDSTSSDTDSAESSDSSTESSTTNLEATSDEEREYIEETLNLANNSEVTWSYDEESDAWVMSIVSAVAYPELVDEQGVSVCVPGAYIKGIDTDGDGTEDITADNYTDAVNGTLVIDYEAEVTSSNGQVYTASTAPCIINTGAAGYSSSTNSLASTEYASEGYINIACGNRGKQDQATDEDGNTYYTGDAPSCLVDQKNAARFVKYNIALGNLPGSSEYFVSTGGSGGGAHATMFAVTSDNEDFYDYEIECGAVGVYRNEDGSYTTTVSIDGEDVEITDGAWGCVAYSAITSLYEADMALAFEYYLNSDYDFNTSFQTLMAEYLSEEYMEYINDQNLTVEESAVGFDLNGDGDTDDTIALTIEYDEEKYADTNGYGGTYLDLYLAEFTQNLQWYLDNLDYAEGWTWFDEDGNALSDEEVAAMTTEDKAEAFIEGRYAKSSSSDGMGGPGGDMGGAPDGAPSGEAPDGMGDMASSDSSTDSSTDIDASSDASSSTSSDSENSTQSSNEANQLEVGTPDEGTTQSAGSTTDSANYSTFAEMVEAYEEDIEEIYSGDKYGNNIVSLYNPLNYISEDNDSSLVWTRIVMGAAEGDMSMFASLNLQIAMLNAGIDAELEWQWDGGHVPSEIFGESLSLYVDQMYGEYVEGAVTGIEKEEATAQTENGDATEATGTDISSWVDYSDISDVSVTLADAVSYRTEGASKAMPGFDVMDYGQEDYVFGNTEQDARHWDKFVLEVFKDHYDELEAVFNQG